MRFSPPENDPAGFHLNWNHLIPTLISVIVLVLLFIAGKYIDSKIRKKERKRNWYLKVIVETNLSKIEYFIETLKSQTSCSILNLVGCIEGPHDAYVDQKITEIGKFQDIKRKFETDFLILIKITSPDVFDEHNELIRDLEDEITILLDKDSISKDDTEYIEDKIKSYKQSFYQLLYKPLES